MFSSLDRLYRHAAWADLEVFKALEGRGLEAAEGLYAHIVVAERIWLSRILGQELSGLTPWTRLPLAECGELSASTLAAFRDLIAATPEGGMDRPVEYRSLKGDPFRSPLGDILLHVALHGAHHRGQIATLLRGAGAQVPATDYILFSRQLEADI